jgi:hypothetical protein
MGAETACAVTVNGQVTTAKARIETQTLQIRGNTLKLDVPFARMKKVAARNGSLSITHAGGTLSLALGSAAEKWLEKILRPRSRLTKLGVRADWRATVVGHVETEFVEELRGTIATLSVGRVLKDADAIFVGVARPADLARVPLVKSAMKPAGAVWLIRPKGNTEVTEQMVMAAGKAAGLVDVKVVGFSSTHSALKFVIPLKNRPR